MPRFRRSRSSRAPTVGGRRGRNHRYRVKSRKGFRVSKILIVDDEAPIRALMRATLTMAGHQVVEAAGGEEALEKIKKENVELIVLDIMMPVTDGYEVLERIKAIPAKAHIPVIVVTAKSYESEGIMREMTAGAIDHLSKPFDPEDLEIAVSRALTASEDQLDTKRAMMSRGANLYNAVDKMRQLAREAEPAGRDNSRRRR
ncbi:MAG: response regulator [Actinobacteria bacterium]|nr:MAG: response regulator [Actinomycetota bacterium]